MENFGLTLIGYNNYLVELLKEDYQEPTILPNVKEIIEHRLHKEPKKTFNEIYNIVDPVIGTADGFAYGSYERMRLQKKKGLFKPVGPTDMFRIPATEAQKTGFWTKDSLLKDATWMKWSKYYGSRSSEITK